MRKLMLAMFAQSVALSASAWFYYASPSPAPGAAESPDYCLTEEMAGTVADALAKAAHEGDEVVLLDGVYRVDWPDEGLAVGHTVVFRSKSDDPEKCVLIGDDKGRLGRAFTVFGDGVVFRALTFRRFRLVQNAEGTFMLRGAALYMPATDAAGNVVSNRELFVENCNFDHNQCGPFDYVFPERGVTLLDCVPERGGGAIYMDLENILRADGCRFTTNGTCYAGGAIFCRLATLNDCVFEGNMVSNQVVAQWSLRSCGGAVMSYSNGMTRDYPGLNDLSCHASNCVFRGNAAYNPWVSRGGAGYNLNTYRCVFDGNIAVQGRANCGYQNHHTHIEDRFTDYWFRDWEKVFPERCGGLSLGGDEYFRCVINRCSSQPLMTESRFYNCLIDQNIFTWMCEDTATYFYSCTFVRNCNSRDGSKKIVDWNSSYFRRGALVNCLMADNIMSSGAIFNPSSLEGGVALANDIAQYMTNTIYQCEDAWAEVCASAWTANGNRRYVDNDETHYLFKGRDSEYTCENAYDYLRHSYGIDYTPAPEVDPRYSERRSQYSYDLLGRKRVVNEALDAGCYEFQTVRGISVSIR